MAYQMTFMRYELKYLLTRQEKEYLLEAMRTHMKLDVYGMKHFIRRCFYLMNGKLIMLRTAVISG